MALTHLFIKNVAEDCNLVCSKKKLQLHVTYTEPILTRHKSDRCQSLYRSIDPRPLATVFFVFVGSFYCPLFRYGNKGNFVYPLAMKILVFPLTV